MAVHIRLSRTGRLNRPFFRIGVYDSRTRRDGKVLDELGFYDPILSTGTLWKVDMEKLAAWIKKGAKPSGTIASYLKTQKFVFTDTKQNRADNKAHSRDRQEARRRTGRTVVATAKAVMPKKPGGAAAPKKGAKKAAAKPKAAPKPKD